MTSIRNRRPASACAVKRMAAFAYHGQAALAAAEIISEAGEPKSPTEEDPCPELCIKNIGCRHPCMIHMVRILASPGFAQLHCRAP